MAVLMSKIETATGTVRVTRMRHGDGRAAQAGSLRLVITRQAVSLDSPEEREKRSVCKMEPEEVRSNQKTTFDPKSSSNPPRTTWEYQMMVQT